MTPKTIRFNANLIVLFKFANKNNVLEDIYPVVSVYATENEFEQLYDFATSQPHGGLVIDETSRKTILNKILITFRFFISSLCLSVLLCLCKCNLEE